LGIIRTDGWLDEDYTAPLKICTRLSDKFEKEDPRKIYEYLLQFGMYEPNRQTLKNFEQLKDRRYWEKAESIFKKYKKKWSGPDIPIYIFPLAAKTTFFRSAQPAKAGVAFKDKLFLFLTPLDDEKELEALMIHEYHHTCRLNKQNNRLKEFTLLDSVILEGLAEHAVEEILGENYIASWCNYYSSEEVSYFWRKFIKPNLQVKKEHPLHDEILYGRKGFPVMAGYSAGYNIISKYKSKRKFNIEESFNMEADSFLKIFQNNIRAE